MSASLWNQMVAGLIQVHAWVVGQVPSWRCTRGNHTLMFLSLSQNNKWINKILGKKTMGIYFLTVLEPENPGENFFLVCWWPLLPPWVLTSPLLCAHTHPHKYIHIVRERERERDRETERQRETETETKRERACSLLSPLFIKTPVLVLLD